MWPYSSDEQVWLAPGKEWAETRPKPSKPATAVPANENGAWPYAANDDVVAHDKRPFDPQTFVGK
jgi:hypothetical protein